MEQIMETRQKAFNLSSHDGIGSVIQKSIDILLSLINSRVEPEKVSLAENDLGQERTLESGKDGTKRIRDLCYKISEELQISTFWISSREIVKMEPCEQSDPNNNAIQNHISWIAKERALGKVDCEICGKTQKSRLTLNYHKRIHHNHAERHKCDVCQKDFGLSSTLKRHALTHLAIDDPRRNNQDAFCEICNRQFKSKYTYKDHMRVHETNEDVKKPHKCDLCEKSFTHIFNLKKHKRSHTNDETIKKPHQCKDCNRRFTLGWMLPHDDPRKKGFECKICGKILASMTTLRYHKKAHLGSKRKQYKCNLCDKVFAAANSLRFHKNTRTGNFRLKCEICGKGLNTKQEMRWHMSSHKTKKNKCCDLCPRRFEKDDDLAVHVKRHKDGTLNPESELEHSDSEIFQCFLCDKKYLWRASLQDHTKKKHELAGNYRNKTTTKSLVRNKFCILCPRRFAESNDLAEHVKRHKDGTLNPSSEIDESDTEIFQCAICDMKYLNRRSMQDHMRDKHDSRIRRGKKEMEQSEASVSEDEVSETSEEETDDETSESDDENENAPTSTDVQ